LLVFILGIVWGFLSGGAPVGARRIAVPPGGV